ncbi:glycerophosphodiester phosphodiesterase family protein [Planotetraspora sp. A-T 1434]|uniref:glycerophosphodiester phosphodiesterase n=1 Tax=Planotetraspora sp. A-T 1434 TaxID=2979219 RepID=UPI0021BEF6DC|nr:glycerophosphodiester phosphodiesterase family protein [Planotetraspora sp. A-T 1434]MCT9933740.1 glycerophosphodiester phosphodiesterase family protein [Planotetraspora sp. A-T 1434]
MGITPKALAISFLLLVTLGEVGGGHDLARVSASLMCSAPGVVSHRGYQASGAENTLRAFQGALDAGSGQVELDVRFTRDHHPVLMHDDTVDRTTTGAGRVSDMSLAQFRALRTTDGQRPPTLSAALELVRSRGGQVLVELKQIPGVSDLRTLQRDYRRLNAYGWASLMSFSPSAMQAVRSIPARKGLLATSAPPTSLARKFAFVGIRYDNLTRARVRAYIDAGVAVYAWTPNERNAWRRLAGYGVNRVVTDQTPAYLAWAATTCRS